MVNLHVTSGPALPFPHSPLSLSLSLFSVLSLHLSLFLQMVQVFAGNLRALMYAPHLSGEVRPRPLGLIADVTRLIESSSSILEVSIPQSSYHIHNEHGPQNLVVGHKVSDTHFLHSSHNF